MRSIESFSPLRILLSRWVELLLVAVALSAWVFLYYRDGFGLGFLSDSYGLLGDARKGLERAFFWRGGNHFIPGTYLYLGFLYKFFGVGEQGYQWLSLLHLVVNGGLLYYLGKRWLGSKGWALIASLIFVANSSFFQVTLWPVNGNVHNLSLTLYLVGLLVLEQAVRSARPRLLGWIFAGLAFIAFFSYELTITMTVVGGCLLWLRSAEADERDSWEWLRVGKNLHRWVVVLAPTIFVGLVALGFKIFSLGVGARAVNAEGLYVNRITLLLRSILSTFSSTALGADTLREVVFFGQPIAANSSPGRIILSLWVLALLITVVWVLRRSGSAVRVLVLWLLIHFFLCHLVTGLASRHCFLAAPPAALLWVFGVRALIARVGRKRADQESSRRRAAWLTACVLVSCGLASLQVWSWFEVQRAVEVHWRATRASRSLRLAIAEGLDHQPDAKKIMLINMPRKIAGNGLLVFVFSNGLSSQVDFMLADRFQAVALRRMEGQPLGAMANGSKVITEERLSRVRRKRLWIIVRFDPKNGTVEWLPLQPKAKASSTENRSPKVPKAVSTGPTVTN